MKKQQQTARTITETEEAASILDSILEETVKAVSKPAPKAAPKAKAAPAPALFVAPSVTGGVAQFVAPALVPSAPNPFATVATAPKASPAEDREAGHARAKAMVERAIAKAKAREAAPKAAPKAAPAPAPKAAPEVIKVIGAWTRAGKVWGIAAPGAKEGQRIQVRKKSGQMSWVTLGAQVSPGVFLKVGRQSKVKAKPRRQCPGNNNCRRFGWPRGPRCR